MTFAERLRKIRTESGITQQKLAEMCGMSLRSITNYESGERMPNSLDIVKRIASALGTTYDVLLAEEDQLVIEAHESAGAEAARDVSTILRDVNGLFAGGEMSEDDKDKVMHAIMDMYWSAKEANKKYGKNK